METVSYVAAGQGVTITKKEQGAWEICRGGGGSGRGWTLDKGGGW